MIRACRPAEPGCRRSIVGRTVMSDSPERKRKLVGPWRNLHGAVWLIGLAILAWTGWWWPGILVLLAISTLLEGALMQFGPHAFVEEAAAANMPEPTRPAPVPAAPAADIAPEHRE